MASDNDSRKDWNLFDDVEEEDTGATVNPPTSSKEDDGDDAAPDFFDGQGPEPKPKEPKLPKLSRDNPEFWDREESPWEHLRPSNPWRLGLWVGSGILSVFLLLILFIAVIGVSRKDEVQYGYLNQVEEKGKMLKTYEAEMIPYVHNRYSNAGDKLGTDSVFRFSIPDKGVYDRLQQIRDSIVPVKITYKVYNTAMPWRGESRAVVTKVEIMQRDSVKSPQFIIDLKPRRSEPKDTINSAKK